MKSADKIPVQCNECGKQWKVAGYTDTCPKCGGADIDVRESLPKKGA